MHKLGLVGVVILPARSGVKRVNPVKSVSAGQICMYMCMYYICWRASLRNQTITSRMERLTSTLKSVLDKKHGLQTVVFALENLALTSQERKPDCRK